MVREEIRLLRVDVRKRQDEVLMLNLELEDAYIELDAIGVLSMEAIEGRSQPSIHLVNTYIHFINAPSHHLLSHNHPHSQPPNSPPTTPSRNHPLSHNHPLTTTPTLSRQDSIGTNSTSPNAR